MGSATRTTGSYAGAITQARINELRASIGTGKLIRQSDIDSIYAGLYNSNGHTHSYFSQITLNDYGDGLGGTTTSGAYTTAGATPGYPFTLNTKVLASDINNFINQCVGVYGWRNHSHSYTDY
jgi:hypothetical protein